MANRTSLKSSALVLLLTAVCASCDDQRAFREQMALLEQAGVAHRDCTASIWYSQQRGATPLEWVTPTEMDRALHTPEANAACKATLRLVKETATDAGLFRTYRCEFRGQQVEVSYSAARNDRDQGLFRWCEYALSGDTPFKDGETYTQIRER